MSCDLPLLRRFGRFNLIGLLGAALQLLLLFLMTKCFGCPPVAASALAVEVVVLHNFAWHERFTWQDRPLGGRRQSLLRLWRFHAGNGFTSLVGNTLLTYLLVVKLRVPVLPATLVAIVVCSLVNFVIADRWVYADASSAALGMSKP